MKYGFAIDEGGPKRLTIEVRRGVSVLFDGQTVQRLPEKECRTVRQMELPDGSHLELQLGTLSLPRVWRNGRLVPGWEAPARELLGKAMRLFLLVAAVSLPLGLIGLLRPAVLPTGNMPALPPMSLVVGGSLLLLGAVFMMLRWWPGLAVLGIVFLADTALWIAVCLKHPLLVVNVFVRAGLLLGVAGGIGATRFINETAGSPPDELLGGRGTE